MRDDSSAVIAALERQRADLEQVLARLQAARIHLIPEPAQSWQGTARRSFDTAVQLLAAVVLSTEGHVIGALQHTSHAITGAKRGD